jgi:hypothetical protein
LTRKDGGGTQKGSNTRAGYFFKRTMLIGQEALMEREWRFKTKDTQEEGAGKGSRRAESTDNAEENTDYGKEMDTSTALI